MVAALVLSAGCAARRYPLPMTAAQLAREDGPALAAYLGQPDAGAGVCDLGADGPHAVAVTPVTRRALDEAFREGRIPPDRWLACVDRLLRTADPPMARALLTDAVRAARDLASGRGLDADAGATARFAAIARLYAERPREVAAEPLESTSLLKRLEADLPRGFLGTAGQAPGAALLASLRLERGAWDGAPVDEAWLDRLAAAGDVATLRLAAARLPEPALRAAARRRVIRLRQAGSPFPEARGPEVEEAVARLGRNPVALAAHPPVRGWLEPGRLPPRIVLVEQRVAERAARLLAPAPRTAAAGPSAAATVLPEVALRGALQVELSDLSEPVTLCADPRELDPAPCLAAADVATGSPLAQVGADGALRLADTLRTEDVLPLAGEARLDIPLTAGGLPVAALTWPLRFLPPPALVLEGAGLGSPGPDLEVRVEAIELARLAYTASSGVARYHAVVESGEAAAFRVVSRGGRGAPGGEGAAGSSGASGADGRDASCPDTPGQDGGRGGDGGHGGEGGAGGAGGPGGRGGDVRVVVSAPLDLRDELVRLLRGTVLSEGGPGGEGGSGGRGGPGGSGGRGGRGATCLQSDGPTVWLSSGRDGADGADGAPGSTGWAGTTGTPGRVVIVVEP